MEHGEAPARAIPGGALDVEQAQDTQLPGAVGVEDLQHCLLVLLWIAEQAIPGMSSGAIRQ